jgi:protein O-mannosyl-transferase
VKRDRGSRWAEGGAVLLLVAAVLWTFWPALRCGFVNYDDPVYVTGNRHTRAGLTWPGVRWAFISTDAVNWHPLTWISHMADCQLYGLNAAGHHLTSVLLHAANAALLFLLLRRMTGAAGTAWFASALFALHPLRVESVVWIAERKDVLSAFFWMLTLWAYVRYTEEKPKQPRESLLCGARSLSYALGAHGQAHGGDAAVRFAIAGLLAFAPERALAVRLAMEKIPFLVLTCVSCVMTIWAQHRGGAVASLALYPFWERLGNVPLAYASYLGKEFWPRGFDLLLSSSAPARRTRRWGQLLIPPGSGHGVGDWAAAFSALFIDSGVVLVYRGAGADHWNRSSRGAIHGG